VGELLEIHFLCEVAEPFQRRIANGVHSGLGIGHQPTDEVAEHRKMGQTTNADALEYLCAKGILNSLELLDIP
jgi:hypothetical protein